MASYTPGDLMLGPNTMAITRLLQDLRHNTLTPQAVINFGLKAYDVLAGQRQLNFADMLSGFVQGQDIVAFWKHQHPDALSEAIGNHALRILATLFGHSLPPASNGKAIIREIQFHSNKAAERFPEHVEPGLLARARVRGLEVLLHDYAKKVDGITVVQDYIPDTEEWQLTDRTVQRYEEQANELAGYLAQYSGYTVKPCFMQDGMLHRRQDAYVMLDGPELYDKLASTSRPGYVTPIAAIHLTERDKIKSTELQFKRQGYGQIDTLSPDYPLLMGFDVLQDGTLAIDNYGFVPLRYIFDIAGRGEVYQLFRLMQLLRLSDLVISTEKRIEHGVPSFPPLGSSRRAREKHMRNLVQEFPKIWLPRLRALADKTTPQSIETEIREDEAFTERTTRSVGRREGHWRQLQPNQKASPEAIENALRERKKEPPKGYTYVKLRKGDGLGHEARRRRA